MSTTAIGSTASTGTTTTSSSSNLPSNLNLTTSDFINLLLTQLQNQDPTQPTSSDEIMSQLSQIGQLQSTSSLNSTLATMSAQTQISSAASLMGKSVQGLDANNTSVSGTVTAVQVSGTTVNLTLDSGSTLALSQVSSITAPATTTSTNNTTAG